MRVFLFFLVFHILGCGSYAQTREIPVNEEILKLSFDAIGFYEGTLFTLDTLEKLFPNSKAKCTLARIHFRGAFREAQENLYGYVYDAMGKDKVDLVVSSGLEEYRKLFDYGESLSDFTDKYVNIVEDYCIGKIPSPTRETLLYFKYIQNPHKELTDGFFEYFNTKGHAKSAGLEIKLKVPITFEMAEGQRPHVVQRFNEFEGNFGTKGTLTIVEIPETEGFWDAVSDPELMTEENMLEICLDEGAILRSIKIVKIDGIPFTEVESFNKRTSVVGAVEFIQLSYTSFFKNRMINLSFSTLVNSGSEVHYLKNVLLYKTIASSMIFMDRWK